MTTQTEQYIKSLPVYQKLYGKTLNQFRLADGFVFPVFDKTCLKQAFPNGWLTPLFEQAEQHSQIIYFSTSGTTGEKVHVFGSLDFHLKEFYRLGYAFQELRYPVPLRQAVLTTATCSALGCVNALEPYADRVQAPGRIALNHLNNPFLWQKSDIIRMVVEMDRFQPNYWLVDPIYLAVFILLAKQYQVKLNFPYLQAVVYSFEYGPKACIALIEKTLNLPVYSAYGMSETGMIYVQTPCGHMRLIPNQTDVSFKPIDETRRLYELYVTTTNNELMPLVNFQTGDVVQVLKEDLDKVQTQPKSVRLSALAGRRHQCLTLASGAIMSIAEVDAMLFKCCPDIYLYRIQQYPHEITIEYATQDQKALSPEQLASLTQWFEQHFKQLIKYRFMRSISPTASGKFLLTRRLDDS